MPSKEKRNHQNLFRKNRFVFLLLIPMFAAGMVFSGASMAKNDSEWWNMLTFKKKLSPVSAVRIALEVRSFDDMRRNYYERIHLILERKLTRSWKTELGMSPYRSERRGQWSGTDMYTLGALFERKSGLITMGFRAQWEYNSHTEEDILRLKFSLQKALALFKTKGAVIPNPV